MIVKEIGPARHQVSAALTDYGETPRADLDRLSYSEAEVLEDWFPVEVQC